MVKYKAHGFSDFWKGVFLIWLFGFVFFVLRYLEFAHMVALLYGTTVTLE